jgi:hypothetical protein
MQKHRTLRGPSQLFRLIATDADVPRTVGLEWRRGLAPRKHVEACPTTCGRGRSYAGSPSSLSPSSLTAPPSLPSRRVMSFRVAVTKSSRV